jgi:hypothetical protein
VKSRQVGFVLIALIVVGVAGLIARAVSTGSDELVLSGLLPLTIDVVDTVSISSDESTAELERIGTDWRAGQFPVFEPKLLAFWSAVSDIDGAQLVANNPANHSRMGVADGQGTTLGFFLGGVVQEQFLVGNWSPEVRLCYLRRPGKSEVYSIPCASPELFNPDPDSWRNRIVLSFPRDAVESIGYTYPSGEAFFLFATETGAVVVSEEGEEPADGALLLTIMRALGTLPEATGFATEEEARVLSFDASTPSIVIDTIEGSGFPTTRLRFIPRDDTSYWVKNPADTAVYIMDRGLVEFLLRTKEDFVLDTGG